MKLRLCMAFTVCFLLVTLSRAQAQSEPKLRKRSAETFDPKDVHPFPGVQCIIFDPETLTKDDVRHGPRVFGNLHWLFGNKHPRDEKDVLKIIQHYGMNAACTINDSYLPFHFMLVDGQAPVGKLSGEFCHPHHVSDYHIVYYGPGPIRLVGGHGSRTGYRIVARFEGRDAEWVWAFDQKEAAQAAMEAIYYYDLGWECRGYMPGSFSYMKKGDMKPE